MGTVELFAACHFQFGRNVRPMVQQAFFIIWKSCKQREFRYIRRVVIEWRAHAHYSPFAWASSSFHVAASQVWSAGSATREGRESSSLWVVVMAKRTLQANFDQDYWWSARKEFQPRSQQRRHATSQGWFSYIFCSWCRCCFVIMSVLTQSAVCLKGLQPSFSLYKGRLSH